MPSVLICLGHVAAIRVFFLKPRLRSDSRVFHVSKLQVKRSPDITKFRVELYNGPKCFLHIRFCKF